MRLAEIIIVVLVAAFAILATLLISVAWDAIQKAEYDAYIDRAERGEGFRHGCL